MRVLIVASRYHPHRGGVETVVRHLAAEFHRLQHDVEIVCPRYPRSLPAREVIDGIAVTRLPFVLPRRRYLTNGRPWLWGIGWLAAPYALLALLRAMRRFRPDVMNLHYVGSPAPFVVRACCALQCPLVVSLHGGDVDAAQHRHPEAAHALRSALASASQVTCCSQALLSQALAIVPEASDRSRVIHNGVDVARFAEAQAWRNGKPYVAAVGQLVDHKGFDLLIRAFAQAVPQDDTVDLLIGGDGPARGELRDLIASLGAEGRVHMLGALEPDGVAALMLGSVLVAVPSRREAFGVVALEAMAAGKPILATPVGGLPEFVPADGNALVQPVLDKWVAALRLNLAHHGGAKTHLTANVEASRGFGWPDVAGRYAAAYREALHG